MTDIQDVPALLAPSWVVAYAYGPAQIGNTIQIFLLGVFTTMFVRYASAGELRRHGRLGQVALWSSLVLNWIYTGLCVYETYYAADKRSRPFAPGAFAELDLCTSLLSISTAGRSRLFPRAPDPNFTRRRRRFYRGPHPMLLVGACRGTHPTKTMADRLLPLDGALDGDAGGRLRRAVRRRDSRSASSSRPSVHFASRHDLLHLAMGWRHRRHLHLACLCQQLKVSPPWLYPGSRFSVTPAGNYLLSHRRVHLAHGDRRRHTSNHIPRQIYAAPIHYVRVLARSPGTIRHRALHVFNIESRSDQGSLPCSRPGYKCGGAGSSRGQSSSRSPGSSATLPGRLQVVPTYCNCIESSP